MRKNSQKKYDKILETAIRLFNGKGIHVSGVDLISNESGVAKMTLYKYFQSKDGLIKKYLDHIAAVTLSTFNSECASQPARECIGSFFDLALKRFHASGTRACPLICASLEISKQHSELHSIISSTYNNILHSLDMKLYDYQYKDARDGSYQILSLYQGAVILSYMTCSDEPLRRAKNQALALLD